MKVRELFCIFVLFYSGKSGSMKTNRIPKKKTRFNDRLTTMVFGLWTRKKFAALRHSLPFISSLEALKLAVTYALSEMLIINIILSHHK